MCRLAAFPPNVPAKVAIDFMTRMVGNNDDGVGTAYIRDRQFVLNKHPGHIDEALNKGIPLFKHMPCDSWTIAHVRYATHGGNTLENTHPFVKGRYCIAHNGVYNDHDAIRLALAGSVKWQGETDSETAAFMIKKLGPSSFMKLINRGGVYLALDRDGSLHVMKSYGDLEFVEINKNRGYIISSEIHGEWKKHASDFKSGYFHMGPNGFMIHNPDESPKEERSRGYGGFSVYNTGSVPGDCSSKRNGTSGEGCKANYPPYLYQLGSKQSNTIDTDTGRFSVSGFNSGIQEQDREDKRAKGNSIYTNPELWQDYSDLCD